MLSQLERVSKNLFEKYSDEITALIGRSSGIYALYDDDGLYYVGKAGDLKNRVKAHLKDRHLASWSHFSLYLVRDAEHIGDLESLLIRVAAPLGNKNRPKGRGSSQLTAVLRTAIKARQKEELEQLTTGFPHRAEPEKRRGRKQQTAKELVDRDTPIFRTYKGRDYKAKLQPSGTIVLKGVRYPTPSAAAVSITKRAQNGWSFWYYKNPATATWERLRELRK